MPRFTRREFIGAAAVAASTPLLPTLAHAEAAVAEAHQMTAVQQASMDADLTGVTVARLHELYAARTYTVTQVTRWHLARIARFDAVYRAVSHVTAARALRTAAAQDAAAKASGTSFRRTALWGVPVVIKANTSIKGMVTSAGWCGYLIPGLELVAPDDATVAAKLEAAGAVVVGQTNMPDFAASDTTISSAFGRTGNAYDPRFSPGGSSGGTVTSVAGSFAVLGTGTDTGNSIRMPAGTSALVGVLPTRGLVSIAGIHPLDWLRDNTGPIARTVADAAAALDVMAGEDRRDVATAGSAAQAQRGPYVNFLKRDALMGRQFGVPTFVLTPATEPVSGPDAPGLRADTRVMFLKAVDALRAAGARVVFDDTLLPPSFLTLVHAVGTQAHMGEGVDDFLRDYGPAAYHSAAEYAQAVGSPIPAFMRAGGTGPRAADDVAMHEARRVALAAYDTALDHFQLDGLVYPALQMQPNDETIPLRSGGRSNGPHSETAWVNPLGVPAVVVPAGFYASGLPFGLELSARRWRDGDLLGWAYAFEQATMLRKAPTLRTTR